MVTLLRRGWAALSIVVLVGSAVTGPANAQGAQPVVVPNPDVGFIGIPDFTSAETDIPFFEQQNAQRVDQAMSDMRNAAANATARLTTRRAAV